MDVSDVLKIKCVLILYWAQFFFFLILLNQQGHLEKMHYSRTCCVQTCSWANHQASKTAQLYQLFGNLGVYNFIQTSQFNASTFMEGQNQLIKVLTQIGMLTSCLG